MINNSTKINKQNNCLSRQIIGRKTNMTYTVEIQVMVWDRSKKWRGYTGL
jgi:hypothetical protein